MTRNNQEIIDRGEFVSVFHRGVDYAARVWKGNGNLKIRSTGLLLSNGFYSFTMFNENDPAITKIQEQIREMITYDWPTRK